MDALLEICTLNALAVVALAVLAWAAFRYALSSWLVMAIIVTGILGSACVDYVMISVGVYDGPWETAFASVVYAVGWWIGRPGPSSPGSR
ncbi:hypothetical protein [Methanopyrus sp. KOL6]|uniref:hypothetical protein n=1 Tax=Methanopyrus sp. KOL6 TaxID=1937004 RepID=UPI000B4B2B67|nr:hypothetical protein [Methanopyrus sp. KOL6]